MSDWGGSIDKPGNDWGNEGKDVVPYRGGIRPVNNGLSPAGIRAMQGPPESSAAMVPTHEQPVDLAQIRELLFSDKAVVIPAGQGKEAIRILPGAGYMRVDYKYTDLEPEMQVHQPVKKSPPAYYAVYLFGIGDDVREIRTLRLPVQLKGQMWREEELMVKEMASQGLDEEEIRRVCDINRSAVVGDQASGNALRSLRMALRTQNFLTTEIHPELQDNGEHGRVYSGWQEVGEPDGWAFMVLSQPAPQILWYVDIPPLDRDSMTREETISPRPVSQDAINTAGPELNKLLHRVIAANK